MVRQVATITAAEGAQLALVRLLARVRSHVGLQVALVGRSKWAEVAAVRFLSCLIEENRLNNKTLSKVVP